MNTNRKILLIIAFMLILLAAATIINVAINFRDYSYTNALEKSKMTAEVVRDGLTAHMVNGVMDKRNFFLTNISQYEGVKKLWIVRSSKVDSEYGPGLPKEEPRDEMDSRVLKSGLMEKLITENSDTASLRVSIPYIASSLDTPNCLSCHHVNEGDVLGVISMEFDISNTRSVGMFTVLRIFGLNVIFIIIALFLTNYYIKPYMELFANLQQGIKKAHLGNFTHRFTTKIKGEGKEVANEMNQLFEKMQDAFGSIKDELQTFVARSNISDADPLYEARHIIHELSDIYKFKKTIELDKDKYAIYQRIYQLLEQKFELKHFALYEVNHSRKERELLYITQGDSFCSHDADTNALECRAYRTSTDIISTDFPNLCDSCDKNGELEYACLPFIINNDYSLILSISAKEKEELGNISLKVTSIKNYFEAAKPVIESKILMDILKESSLRDGLTGLYNRRFLEEYIEQEQAQIQRDKTAYDILMIDIDFFKLVNDTYGHDVGDTVIRALSDILKESKREADLAIRYGGEEFLILLRHTTPEATQKVADAIHSGFRSKKFTIGSETMQKTLSIGIAKLPQDADSIWKVIKYADIALYEAKNTGRNKIVYFKSEMFEGY
ncbi:GGDEF domain-containing protein [Sulfurimonas sp. MAG313]|nr:GGDEF domain-containing protein [Sulfurimonas sp. MAG313]